MRPGPKPLTLAAFTVRFWARVDRGGGAGACWPWQGGHDSAGYGVVNARALLAAPTGTHRVAFWLANGRWPSAEAMHACDNRGCTNPGHLNDGTHKQNMQEARDRGRLKIGGRTRGTWRKGDTVQTRRSAQKVAG
jgi:hypothetical protein